MRSNQLSYASIGELNYTITIQKVKSFLLAWRKKSVMIVSKGSDRVKYSNMLPGHFIRRPNRFIAHVEINGKEEICHVKNTGRCRELLVPGTKVWCQEFDSTTRKTKFDLIAVQKGDRLINMDSQAPNAAAKQWLLAGGLGEISDLRPVTVHGDSRFDFSFTLDGRKCFLEVKGVTLENDGVCAFPDAPTTRGVKHLHGLTRATEEGFGAYVLFVIQMSNVKYLHPNDNTDPEFGNALRQAAEAGVKVLAMDCAVTEDSMTIQNPVEVRL